MIPSIRSPSHVKGETTHLNTQVCRLRGTGGKHLTARPALGPGTLPGTRRGTRVMGYPHSGCPPTMSHTEAETGLHSIAGDGQVPSSHSARQTIMRLADLHGWSKVIKALHAIASCPARHPTPCHSSVTRAPGRVSHGPQARAREVVRRSRRAAAMATCLGVRAHGRNRIAK